MIAEEIYKAALEQLAQNGNQEAKLALDLGTRASSSIGRAGEVKAQLQGAHSALLRALGHNDMSWTRATDRAIEDAMRNIAQALSIL